MAKIWDIPFANAGDKQTIPVPAQPDGTISTTQGWTPDYELPNTNPSYKPVGREEMNGALFEITESIQQLQLQGAAEWSPLFSAYPNGAEVIHSGGRWRSLINGNTEEPGTGSNWLAVSVPLPQASIQGSRKNLRGSATGLNSNASYTADQIIVEDASGNSIKLSNVSVSPSLSASGANGLDSGTSAANTGYYSWVIYNPTTTTTAGLFSLSSATPTMPSGYTYKARVGGVITDNTANKFPYIFKQSGSKVRLVPTPGTNLTAPRQLAAGVAGTISNSVFTPVAVSLANFVLPTAVSVDVGLAGTTTSQALAAPSANFSGWNTTNPTPAGINVNSMPFTQIATIFLESFGLFWGSNNAGNVLNLYGWEDSI